MSGEAEQVQRPQIFSFPDKIASFRDDIITAPIYVRIKPTNICNHACRFCVYSDGTTRPKDRPDLHLQAGMHTSMNERDVMPRDKALELIEDLSNIGTKAVTFSGGGEPLLHKDIVEIMTKTLSSGLDLSIITNGQLLAGERRKYWARQSGLGFRWTTQARSRWRLAGTCPTDRLIP